jgi:exopolysaccharide biosynthesis polyprenyl glycosylphosphotransferase
MSTKAPSWARKYRSALWLVDLVLLTTAGLWSAQLAGIPLTQRVTGDGVVQQAGFSYGWFLWVVLAAWLIMLEQLNSRAEAVIARGTAEYVRVVNSSLAVLFLISTISYLSRAEPSRLLIGSFLLLGVFFLLVGRLMARRVLWTLRANGRTLTRIHLVGQAKSLGVFEKSFTKEKASGYRIVGRTQFDARRWSEEQQLDKLEEGLRARRDSIDIVLITSPELLSASELESFAAKLEAVPLQVAVVAGAEQLATARMRFSVEPNSDFLRVRDADLGAIARISKRGVDIVFSLGLLVLTAPIFFVVAILIALDSRGPVFFIQQRVGQYGRVFPMVKFRTMVLDAESKLGLITGDLRDAGNSVLTKAKSDPRVTRIGTFLRRWSIDELPQLVNVFVGQMSLVGPRPPLATEVKQYEGIAHLRLAAVPGITGLWQVSGRSDLSWEESVRLDLEYVENWSPLVDFIILLRTIPAVAKRTGAY